MLLTFLYLIVINPSWQWVEKNGDNTYHHCYAAPLLELVKLALLKENDQQEDEPMQIRKTKHRSLSISLSCPYYSRLPNAKASSGQKGHKQCIFLWCSFAQHAIHIEQSGTTLAINNCRGLSAHSWILVFIWWTHKIVSFCSNGSYNFVELLTDFLILG